MEKIDFSFGAYKQGPAHLIVAADTRREIARVHHKEDLEELVKIIHAHQAPKVPAFYVRQCDLDIINSERGVIISPVIDGAWNVPVYLGESTK